MMITDHQGAVRAEDLPLQLGRYRLHSILGEGGMARVFRAELLGPAGFRKPVALKMLKAFSSDERAAWADAGLAQEARLGGLLKHPNIVDIYELGEHGGCTFISMELVSGLTLRDLLRECRSLAESVLLEIAKGAVAGLAQAHSFRVHGRKTGLVHRDLKPSNILISWNGEVKISDFGIALPMTRALSQEERPGTGVAGTPRYMSPEQARGLTLDGRSDLFSMGLVLFELAMGRRLLRSGELLQRLPRATREEHSILGPLEREEVDRRMPGLGEVIERCLQPLPVQRYDSAESLWEALDRLSEQASRYPSLLHWIRTSYPDLSDDLGSLSSPTPTRPDQTPPTSPTLIEPLVAGSNLGPPLDRFIGRERELVELGQRRRSGARLITLKGTGGAGKTRLARHFGRTLLSECAGGVWFVDLTEARSAMAIVQAMSRTLRFPLASDWGLTSLVNRAGRAMRARGPMVLILDNVEQLVSQAPQTVGRWLELVPESVFIVTSRERLQIGGEEVIELDPLPEAEGIELFEHRASANGARWEDSEDARNAVREIVRELDGIPLAIELAASRSVLLPPIALASRLRERFELLGGSRRDHGSRQATLWGLIDWSWTLLSDWERTALAQLSVFRGGFHLEAAEAVLSLEEWSEAPWVLDVIGALLDKSLLVSREVLGQPRFGMYISVRDFAERQLDELDPDEGTRRRHAAYFARLGSEETIAGLTRHGGLERRRMLSLEFENCLCGAASAVRLNQPAAAVGCAMAAAVVLQQTGPFVTGVETLNAVLGLPGVSDRDRARLVHIQGDLLVFAGQAAAGLSRYEEALSLSREIGDRSLEVGALNSMGGLYSQQGRSEESLEVLEQALRVSIELRDVDLEARARRNLAILHRISHGGLEYREVLQAALERCRIRGDRAGEALNLGNLAIVDFERGEVGPAEANYRRALRIYREEGHRRLGSITKGNLANLLNQMGRLDEAMALYEQALQDMRELGDRRAAGNVLGNLGNFYRYRGRLDEAEACLLETVQIARELDNHVLQAVGQGNLGDILLAQGRVREARQALTIAIELCDAHHPKAAGAFKGSLALIEAREGQLGRARALLSEGERALRGTNQQELAKLLCKRGEIALLEGDRGTAQDSLLEARQIASDIRTGEDSDLGEALRGLASGIAASSRVSN